MKKKLGRRYDIKMIEKVIKLRGLGWTMRDIAKELNRSVGMIHKWASYDLAQVKKKQGLDIR